MDTSTSIFASSQVFDSPIGNRREQIAQTCFKVAAWALGSAAVGIAGLWLAFTQYAQLGVWAGVFALAALGVALYPRFKQQGRSILGTYVALSVLLLACGLSVVIVPGTLAASIWGCAALLWLSAVLLGPAGCRQFTVAIIVLESVMALWSESVNARLFVPLPEPLNLLLMLVSGVILSLLVAAIIYRSNADQEKYLRQVQQAKYEIAQRAAADQVQQQLLQQVNAKLDRRALQLQAAAEVSRATGSILDPDELIQQVVDLTRERFGLYYVGLYLVDPPRRVAVGLCCAPAPARPDVKCWLRGAASKSAVIRWWAGVLPTGSRALKSTSAKQRPC